MTQILYPNFCISSKRSHPTSGCQSNLPWRAATGQEKPALGEKNSASVACAPAVGVVDEHASGKKKKERDHWRGVTRLLVRRERGYGAFITPNKTGAVTASTELPCVPRETE